MKISKKSKLLALTLSATMLISAFSFSVSAATITLGTVETAVDGDIVTVTVPYTTDDEAAVTQATILATVGTDNGDVTYSDPGVNTTPDNIVYIDQLPLSTSFVFSFDKSMVEGKKLFVKVGGMTVTDPAASIGLEVDVGPTYTYGDVNNDGDIDAIDAGLILQRYAGTLLEFPAGADDVGDVNSDGDVDAIDAGLVLQYYAGTLADFPANNK